MKKLVALIMCAVLIISCVSCKKKEEPKTDTNPTETATPTPTMPPTVDDLFAAAEEQAKPLSAAIETIKTASGENAANDSKTFNIPDGKYTFDLDMSFSMNMFDIASSTINGTATCALESVKDVAKGDVRAKMSLKSESVNDGPKDETSENSTTFYIDNTDGKQIVTYSKSADEEDWTKKITTLAEMFESIKDSAENYTGDTDKDKYFANLDVFAKNHSTIESIADGYVMTTEFTWIDFYAEYASDFQKMSESLKSLTESITGPTSTRDYLKEFFDSGSGLFKCTTTYDLDEKIRKIELNVSSVLFSTIIGDTETAPIEIGLPKFNLTVSLEDSTQSAITIPADIIEGAVEGGRSSDGYDWDSILDDGDDSWINNNSDGDVRVASDGVYYIDLGGYELPLTFTPSWKPNAVSYFIFVEPVDSVSVSYACSYVTLGDVASIQEEFDSIKTNWGENANAELREVTIEGSENKSYAITYETGSSNEILLFVAGSQGRYYLEVIIDDYNSGKTINDLISMCCVAY